MLNKDENNATIRISLPKSLVNDFDEVCKSKGYQSRDQAIKDLISWQVEKEKS